VNAFPYEDRSLENDPSPLSLHVCNAQTFESLELKKLILATELVSV